MNSEHRPLPNAALDDRLARPRRTCLSVPGSSRKMIDKAKTLPADEIFLDLEDAVAVDAKAAARPEVAAALAEPGWNCPLLGFRCNDWTTPWTYADVVEVVGGAAAAGGRIDVIVLPKVSDISHVHALDLLLGQLEREHGLPVGGIGKARDQRIQRRFVFATGLFEEEIRAFDRPIQIPEEQPLLGAKPVNQGGTGASDHLRHRIHRQSAIPEP